MKILGLDIGTTTISAVVTEDGRVIDSLTKVNASFISGGNPWEKIQDPNVIREIALLSVETLFGKYPDIAKIGVAGQMHGIVYLDKNGAAVSPLYTWQDGRGDLPCNDSETYAEQLSNLTGYPLSTGCGIVTHAYNLANQLVPDQAAVFCTIHDHIAMMLAGNSAPVTDPSDAASFGAFEVLNGRFELTALEKAGIGIPMLPKLADEPRIGRYRDKADVYAAIGDNQASYLGASGGDLGCMLVNIGTGSQFSVYTRDYMSCPGLETRPFPGGGYLLVGASLCGGRAYALLEQFFRMTAEMLGDPVESCYGAMEKLLESGKPDDIPTVVPLFQGTRQDPTLRGSIADISTENFTPLHLIWGMMEGMTEELYQMYLRCLSVVGKSAALVGSGNGLRKNVHLQDCFTRRFGQKLVMSDCVEEAAVGAARFAEMN